MWSTPCGVSQLLQELSEQQHPDHQVYTPQFHTHESVPAISQVRCCAEYIMCPLNYLIVCLYLCVTETCGFLQQSSKSVLPVLGVAELGPSGGSVSEGDYHDSPSCGAHRHCLQRCHGGLQTLPLRQENKQHTDACLQQVCVHPCLSGGVSMIRMCKCCQCFCFVRWGFGFLEFSNFLSWKFDYFLIISPYQKPF